MSKSVSSSGMIVIPSGTFRRGSNVSPDEAPVVEVNLSSFAIDITPVTNKQYRVFIKSGGYKTKKYWTEAGWRFVCELGLTHPNYWFDDHWNQDDQPVTGVSWWEALAFATFCGKTLPTEAQWEYACKGTDDRQYPWGNDAPTLEYANFAPDCEPLELNRSSTSVYAHPLNRSYFGCLDMAGNVAEWCLDNASPNYSWDNSRINPVYITSETEDHVVRGGSGLFNEGFMRCSSRDYYPPTLRDNTIGFRCVINLEEDREI